MKNIIKNSVLLIAGLVLVTFTGCNDDDDCKGGSGGNVTIVAKPEHHGATIYSQGNYPDSAFVKFDTQQLPGINPGDYDAIFVGDSGADHVRIEGLKCGQYYIYMTGFDTIAQERVTGGIPIDFGQESGEIEMIIPVTE